MSTKSTSTHDGHGPDTPSASSTTVVAHTSVKSPFSKQSYLDVPAFRPSLDSTYSELSELSFHSTELQNHHPLLRSMSHEAGGSSHSHQPPPSRYGAAWDSFLEVNYGALLVLASQGFGTGMNIAARMLEIPGPHGEPMHPFQMLFVRQSITAFICTAYGLYSRSIPYFPFGMRGIRWLLVLRGVFGFFGVFGMYFSLLYLPLSEATVLTFLAPMLSCYICSFIIPGETFSVQQQIAGFVSLVGVVFIARPASLFSSSSASNLPAQSPDGSMIPSSNSTAPATDSTPHVTQKQHLLAVGIAMIGIAGGTGALTIIRVIGTRAHAFVSINYFSVWCTLVSLSCLIIYPDVKFRLPRNLTEWGWLAVLGSCGFVMQFLLTAGLAYGGPSQEETGQEPPGNPRAGPKIHDQENIDPIPARQGNHVKSRSRASGTRATAMCYTQMLFALAGDKLIFGVSPDTMSWIGSVLILAGAVWVAAAQDTAGRTKSPASSQGPSSVGENNIRSAFGLLRRSTTMKQGESSHEETVGLMATDDIDEPQRDETRGPKPGTSGAAQSMEMDVLESPGDSSRS
jgi:drug/metabolite transporter (DMT)-like permease